MAERSTKRRKRNSDPGILIQDFLDQAGSSEEVLFKVNQLLASNGMPFSRKNVRVPVALPVSYSLEQQTFSGESYTLSQEGIFIKTPDPLPVSSHIELEFKLPGVQEGIKITGEVVHQTTMEEANRNHSLSGMIVIFRRIRSDDRRRIDRFVKSRAKQMNLPR